MADKINLDEFIKLTNLASDLSLSGGTKKYIENLFKDKTPQEIQRMDPIREWERAMGGKNYKQNNDIDDMSMLGFVGTFNTMKTQVLVSAKETHSSMTY